MMNDATDAAKSTTGESETTSGAVAQIEPSVVGVFATHHAAAEAVHMLRRAGVDVKRLSLVGKDYHTEERPVGFYNQGDRIKAWGARGAFWGGLIGILLSPAFFLLPVVGHVFILGPLTSMLVSGLGNAALIGGVSALGAALYGMGIPKNSVIRYETAIKADKFLLIVHRSAEDATQVSEILKSAGAESVDNYGT
jgi:hypothetical protein